MRAVIPALVLASLAPASASAFHAAGSYVDQPAARGGSAGQLYTGSPSFRGWDCSMCHVDAPGRVRVELRSEPPGLFGQGYQPGREYNVVAQFVDETRDGVNSLAFEALTPDGGAAGTLTATGPGRVIEVESTPTAAGRTSVFFAPIKAEQGNRIPFRWTAPVSGTGPVEIYVAAVDGDLASQNPYGVAVDPFNDDVFLDRLELWEQGVTPPSPEPPAGCSAVARPITGLAWLLFIGLVALVARRRSFGSITLVCAALLASGCTEPDVRRQSCPFGTCVVDSGGLCAARPARQVHDRPVCDDGDCFCEATNACVDEAMRAECCPGSCQPVGCEPTAPLTEPGGWRGCEPGRCYCPSDDVCVPEGTEGSCCDTLICEWVQL